MMKGATPLKSPRKTAARKTKIIKAKLYKKLIYKKCVKILMKFNDVNH